MTAARAPPKVPLFSDQGQCLHPPAHLCIGNFKHFYLLCSFFFLQLLFQYVRLLSNLTLVGLGCRNCIKAWGGGQICPTIELFSNMVENRFFKVFHSLYYIKIIIVKVGCVKEKLSKKKYSRKTLGGGQLGLSGETR